MKIKVLASGSKGNCTYIESNNTKLLIDVGINYNKLSEYFEKESLDLNSLDGILISHTHKDHLGGLASLIKKVPTKVFIKEDLFSEVKKTIPKENIELVDNDFVLGDFSINLFSTSHDVPNSGYILDDGKNSLVYITDTGYINRKYIPLTTNKTVYIIEYNHDEKMVMQGPYPYILKERVLSDKGHLSNELSGNYLKEIIGDKTKRIILAHLSEINNTPEIALKTVKAIINNDNIDIETASQNEVFDLGEI